MPAPTIIKEEVVVVDTHELNEYGRLIFTDKAGNEHTISEKRKHLFPVIQDGTAVQLFYAKYMDKLYIADVKSMQEQLAPQYEEVRQEAKAEIAKPTPQEKHNPQEQGMCWKELGCRIGDGSLEKDFPKQAIQIKSIYYNYILTTTGVKQQLKGAN